MDPPPPPPASEPQYHPHDLSLEQENLNGNDGNAETKAEDPNDSLHQHFDQHQHDHHVDHSQIHTPSHSFSDSLRHTPSSHAEAQAALAAVAVAAAAASASRLPMTPTHAEASTSYGTATTPITSSPTPFGTHLGRNKACQSCRSRKLKCDGQKPVCGQCAKAWAIKFRMAQNKNKNRKKGQNSQQLEDQDRLPEYMPPCIYLAVTQRSNSKLSRPATPSHNIAIDEQGSPLATNKKRKRLDDPSDQVTRMQQEIEQLKRQLSQMTGAVAQSAMSASAVYAVQQDGSASRQHPSKDELAIAHMLVSSMPTGEGPQHSQSPFCHAAQAFAATSVADEQQQRHIYNRLAVADTSAVASIPSGGINVLDPALDDSIMPPPTSTPALDSAASIFNQNYPQPQGPEARLVADHQADVGPHPVNGSAKPKHSNVENANNNDLDHPQFASPLLELMVTSWPADFPPPNMVTLLVSIYFERISTHYLFLHPSKFLERLSYGPQHHLFPNRGILHGIFALVYLRLKPCDVPNHPNDALSQARYGHTSADKRAGFKAASTFHAERANALYRQACNEGNFEQAAKIAAMVCSYNYVNDYSFDAWMGSGSQCSLVKAMELNRLPPISTFAETLAEEQTKLSTGNARAAIFRATVKQPSKNALEHEERIRLFWNCYYSDRIACASTHWAENIDDLDIKTELPSSFDDFVNQTPQLLSRERQTIDSADLFIDKHYDPALLQLKSVILHSKCVKYMSRLPNDANVEDVLTPAFHELDSTITAFLQSFPAAWRDIRTYDSTLMPSEASEPSFLSDGVNNRSSKRLSPMTADLVLAHVAAYGSCIAMHEPIAAQVAGSEIKAAHAADAIVAIIKMFVAARVDLLQLGSIITLMIVLAARTNARRYKHAGNEAARMYLEIKRTNGVANIATSTEGGQQSMDALTEETTNRLEKEMERQMDIDLGLQSHLDPDGCLASLRDDLELLFWVLVKYGETFPLGAGQARIVAQLLGKDYSPEMQASGLFFLSSATSFLDSTSISDPCSSAKSQSTHVGPFSISDFTSNDFRPRRGHRSS